MSLEDCPRCGYNSDSPDTFRSTNVLFKRESNGDENRRSWWCFGSRKNDVPKECPGDSVVIGKYEKRQSTVIYTQRLSNFTGVKKKIQDARIGSIIPPYKSNLKVLLVFNKMDVVYDALKQAAEKQGFEITQCSTNESAYDEFQWKHHDLVLIDSRHSRGLNYETLCRAIRNSKGSQHTPIVAVVKKSFLEREDNAVINLLECGFNRCIVESSSVSNFFNDLVQIKMNDMKSMMHKSTTEGLYAALDRCNSLVLITDENFKCQYANIGIEKYLNIPQEDIVGKNINESIVNDKSQLNTIASSLLRGKEWIGDLAIKKNQKEFVTAHCKAISIACFGRFPTHFVIILDVPTYIERLTKGESYSQNEEPRMSSNRKSSFNKLVSLPLEAPITKIVTLLDQARGKVGRNFEMIKILDNVEDLVRKSDLYSTQLRENYGVKPTEPLVSDLVTALLSDQSTRIPSLASRRSSNDSTVIRASRSLRHLTTEIGEFMESALHWDFEIFRLEEITKNRPLQHLGMHLCQHFDVAGALLCDEKTLQNWFLIIESHYHSENCYHNSTHAADVMQATAGFLERERIKIIMEPLDEAMCLLAAAAHDVDHPGKSSAFLANSDSPLAVLYNDLTILENHHAACMFKLTLGDERVNVFKNLDRDTYKIVRHNIVDMILATEMTKHFEHLTKFVNVFCASADEEEDNSDYITFALPENITLIKRMLIKCSDVSNPTRPFRLYVEWARRIAEEYFQQTDEEKINGLPVVMPMFDRNTCSVPKSQIGFVDYIVNDMFDAWNAFIDMPELITYLRQNYIKWREFDEQGHRTLADIRILQSSVLLSPIPRPRITST